MRTLIAITLFGILLLAGCPIPKAGANNVKLLANGQEVPVVQWQEQGRILSIPFSATESSSADELVAALKSIPMHQWLEGDLVLEYGLKMLWQSDRHGLYTTQVEISDGKLILTKGKFIPPKTTTDQAVTYGWNDIYWMDQSSGFFIVETPYQKGAYIVYQDMPIVSK